MKVVLKHSQRSVAKYSQAASKCLLASGECRASGGILPAEVPRNFVTSIAFRCAVARFAGGSTRPNHRPDTSGRNIPGLRRRPCRVPWRVGYRPRNEIGFIWVHGLMHSKDLPDVIGEWPLRKSVLLLRVLDREVVPHPAGKKRYATFLFCRVHRRLFRISTRKHRRGVPGWKVCHSGKVILPESGIH